MNAAALEYYNRVTAEFGSLLPEPRAPKSGYHTPAPAWDFSAQAAFWGSAFVIFDHEPVNRRAD